MSAAPVEIAWARERTETPEALLALLADLKCFQKMARFCSREEIPHAVTDHVRHCLGLAPETEADHGAERTMRLQPIFAARSTPVGTIL